MHHRIVAVLLAGAASAATPIAASAQPTWETRIGFSGRVSGNDVFLPDNRLVLTATGVYTFTIQAGIFNLAGLGAGESNQGVYGYFADPLTASGLVGGEGLGIVANNSRVWPFTFGVGCGFGGCIGWGDARTRHFLGGAREVSGGASAPWLWDAAGGAPGPRPTQPNPPAVGSDSLARVFRFNFTATSLNGPNVHLTLSNQNAGPIIRWMEFGATPPEPEAAGTVLFIGITPSPALAPVAPATLTLVRCGGELVQPVPLQTLVPGWTAELSVRPETTTGVTFQWRRDGFPMSDTGRISGTATPTLRIAAVTPGDIGTYDCLLSGLCPAPFPTEPSVLEVTCLSDFDSSGATTPADISAFINEWLTRAGTEAPGSRVDTDGNGRIEPADLAMFVNIWITGLLNGC